jgi:hypothetical protein
MKRFAVKFMKQGACVFGLRMAEGVEVELDLLESQLPELQALVDAGDVSVAGMSPAPVVVEAPKGKGK